MRRKSLKNTGLMSNDTQTSETFLFPIESMSFAGDSHVKTFPLPANGKGSKERVRLFGEKCTGSFAKLNPDGLWLKTYQGYSQVMMDGSLETFSEIWPGGGV
jgi:hypothetical protein